MLIKKTYLKETTPVKLCESKLKAWTSTFYFFNLSSKNYIADSIYVFNLNTRKWLVCHCMRHSNNRLLWEVRKMCQWCWFNFFFSALRFVLHTHIRELYSFNFFTFIFFLGSKNLKQPKTLIPVLLI